MKTRGLARHRLSILLTACAVFTLLLSACQPVNASTSLPPSQPVATDESSATQPAPEPSEDVTLKLAGLAGESFTETVPAVSPGPNTPWWDVAPEHQRVSLNGYPVSGSLYQPQIFIYPVDDLAKSSEAAGQMVKVLQAVLKDQKPIAELPFLPLQNGKQVMRIHAHYLDFQNGSGVRYLTWYSQGIMEINNAELIYTYQGLTSDGRYYISAVLPVNHSGLPADPQVFAQNETELRDYSLYLTETISWLDNQPAPNFTPHLITLDAFIQSIQVNR